VDLIETSFDEWVKLWAKAFFEEKYWDEVRVIRVHNWDKNISVELCGWTHVSNTRDIWAFTIISQEAVASWIKRITAYTGPKIIEKLHNYEEILDWASKTLDVKSYTQINEKISKYAKENSELQQRIESLETASIRTTLQTAENRSNPDFERIIQLPNGTNFKALTWIVKEVFPSDKSILLYTDEWNYVIITDGWLSAKELAKKHNLRWWGSDLVAQWKDESVKSIS
jgi:alanyl-tRNA synthetase